VKNKHANINPTEWFSAVFLANAMLELPDYPDFNITENDLKNGAMDMLRGLIARHDGMQPKLSDKTKEIIALIQTCAATEIAKNGGGLQ
jgi:hypothetical protein